jgi:hypothetical protein
MLEKNVNIIGTNFNVKTVRVNKFINNKLKALKAQIDYWSKSNNITNNITDK